MHTKEKPPVSLRQRLTALWLQHGGEQLPRLLLRFGIGVMLSQAQLSEGCVPLGAGFVGASGPGAPGFAALCGVLLGHVLTASFTEWLRRGAAAVLICAAAFALYDLPIYRKRWFMPLCCAAAGAVTGFAYLSGAGWERGEVVAWLSEVWLSGLSCLLFRPLSMDKPDKGGVLLLLVGGCACLAGYDTLSAGILAALLTLLSARGGSGTGAIVGGALGLTVGLSPMGTPLLSPVLCLAGALAAAVSTRHIPLLTEGSFLLSGLLATLWVHGGSEMAVQLSSAALLSLCVPSHALHHIDRFLVDSPTAVSTLLRPEPNAAAARCRARLELQAAAYRSLHDRIHQGLIHALSPEPPTSVFECTARRVCRGCRMSAVCWQQESARTRESLNRALAELMDRGRVQPEDFGAYFYASCPNLEQFVRVTNEEFHEYWNRMRYAARIRTSRLAVCRQYLQLSHLLDMAAAEMDEVQRSDPAAAASLERALAKLGIAAQAQVRQDHRRRRQLELRGKALDGLAGEEGCAVISRVLGVRMECGGVKRVRQGQRLLFQEAPPLMATVAAAAAQKKGQRESGDTGTWFRDENGCLWVVLCDGMGSGSDAAEDSRLMMNLLEEFLHAGVDPTTALATVTQALSLRGESNGGFTTVDLLSVDLFTGSTELFKLGGAPTYLRRKGLVSRVMSSALPAGLELDRETVPACSRFRLDAGDFAVLVSDGITDGQSDEALRQALSSFHGESPRELARTLLGFGGGGDDRTVIAVRLSQRG